MFAGEEFELSFQIGSPNLEKTMKTEETLTKACRNYINCSWQELFCSESLFLRILYSKITKVWEAFLQKS